MYKRVVHILCNYIISVTFIKSPECFLPMLQSGCRMVTPTSPPPPLRPAATLWKLTRRVEIDCLQVCDTRGGPPAVVRTRRGVRCIARRSASSRRSGDPTSYFPRDDLFGEAILITRWDMRRRSNCDIRAGCTAIGCWEIASAMVVPRVVRGDTRVSRTIICGYNLIRRGEQIRDNDSVNS